MQTVYVGNTLINDVMLGSVRMTDTLSTAPSIVTTNLTAYFDAARNAGTASWRSTTGNFTASLSQARLNTANPANYQFTGSLSSTTYGVNEYLTSASLSGTGARTILTFVNPSSASLQGNVMWTGNSSLGGLKLFVSASLINFRSDAVATVTQSFSNLGTVNNNNWYMIGYTTDGTNNNNGITVWLNSASSSFSNGGTWDVPTSGIRYWETGTIGGQFPFYGKIIICVAYGRKLTDKEILQNYEYFNYRVGNI